MKNLRLAALFGVTAVLAQACGQQSAKPSDQPAPTASAVFPGLDTSSTDWKTDPFLESARQQFGAPNQNIVVNPNAFNVEQTPSAKDVQQILPDQLVVGAQNAAWLLARNPGDVLYCDNSCGATGFLRRIVDLHLVGNTVVVDTKQAALTDIVLSGWIHGTGYLPGIFAPSTESGVTSSPTSPTTVLQNGTPVTRPDEKTDSKSEGGSYGTTLGGGLKLNTTATFTAKFIFDLTVTAVPVSQIIPNPSCTPCYDPTKGSCYSCDAQWAKVKTEQGALIALFPTLGGDAPQLTLFRIELDPKVEVETSLGGYASIAGQYKKPLFESGPIEIAPMVLGPITLNWTADVSVNAVAAISGQISINGSVTNEYSAQLGIKYTSADGWEGIAEGERSHKANFNAKGEAALKAQVDISPEIGVTVYGVVGPVFGPFAGAGAEVKIEKDLTSACKPPELKVDAFVEYGVQAGFAVRLFPFYTLWTKEVVDQLWSDTIEWDVYKAEVPWPPGEAPSCADAGPDAGPDAGTPDAGSPVDAGPPQDGGFDAGGGGADGGNPDAGEVACSSTSDCTTPFGSCAVCIVVSNICGGLNSDNFCSTNAADTLGLSCSSNNDCDPCNTGVMTCSACAVPCTGNCCNFAP